MNIYFSKYDDLQIKVDCDDSDVLRYIEEYLTDFKSGYRFMPKFKAGVWNGKISLFKKATRSFAYGLLPDILRELKKDYPEASITLSDDVKTIFGGKSKREFVYDLAFKPYDYQQESIECLLRLTKGIVVVATAGGKSLIISYIIRNLPVDSKSLIIVPTLQLVDQFKSDMIDYGIDPLSIGQVNSKTKEFDRMIVVSTWQSLKNQTQELSSFDAVIVDETHTAQADTISNILKGCTNADYRFGVTGTMPTSRLDALTVKSFLGPVLKTFSGRDLADKGYLSMCTINQLWLNYKDKFPKDYQEVRDQVFTNDFRLNVLNSIVARTDNSILILVDKVEKEGVVLEKFLKRNFPDRRVVFLSGKDKSDVRDIWRKDMNTDDNIVCIATYPIFQQGVNIPSLRDIILASSTKSFIRVIQSLGRVLRKHVSKEKGGATLWDICDNVPHLKDHANKRNRHYIKENHIIKELKIDQN